MNKHLKALLGVGTAFALLLGAGLFAVVTDQVAIPGNRGSTGELAPPQGEVDIQLGVPVQGEFLSCSSPDVVWEDGSIPGVFDSTFTVAPGFQNASSDTFCVRRLADPATGDASIDTVVSNFLEFDEVCSTAEADVDPDCGVPTAGAGEISENVFFTHELDFVPDICTFDGSAPGLNRPLRDGSENSFLSVPNDHVTPVCVRFNLNTNINEGSPALAAFQSDRATWDWTLEATVPG